MATQQTARTPARDDATYSPQTSYQRRHARHLRLIDRSIDPIDDDDAKRPPKPQEPSASSTSIDRSRLPTPGAAAARLIRWLDTQGIIGAAGLVDRYGARKVLDTLTREQMLEADPMLYRAGIVRWRIDKRFKNPGGFLNWALAGGRFRAPKKQAAR